MKWTRPIAIGHNSSLFQRKGIQILFLFDKKMNDFIKVCVTKSLRLSSKGTKNHSLSKDVDLFTVRT